MKRKIVAYIMLLLSAFFVLLGCGEQTGSPYDLLNTFVLAVEDEDIDTVYTILNADDEINWTKQQAKQLIQFFQDEQTSFENSVKILAAQADVYERGEISEDNPIRQKYSGADIVHKGALYFDKVDGKYTIYVRSFQLRVVTEINATVEIVGESKQSTGGKFITFDSLFPGKYEVRATANEDASLVAEETIFIFDETKEKLDVLLTFKTEDSNLLLKEDDPERRYKWSCASCHGNDLKGASGPRLDTIGNKLSEEEIIRIIREGKGTMPGGLLSDEHAELLATWLKQFK